MVFLVSPAFAFEKREWLNTLIRLVFVTSFVHWMTQFPEREEEKIFEALADEKKARMDDR